MASHTIPTRARQERSEAGGDVVSHTDWGGDEVDLMVWGTEWLSVPDKKGVCVGA